MERMNEADVEIVQFSGEDGRKWLRMKHLPTSEVVESEVTSVVSLRESMDALLESLQERVEKRLS